MEDKLNSKAYQTVSQRMQTEEATCALTMNNPDDAEYGENFFKLHIISNFRNFTIYEIGKGNIRQIFDL